VRIRRYARISRSRIARYPLGRTPFCSDLTHSDGVEFATRGPVVARLIDTLHLETEALHAEADEEARALLGPVGPADYWRFLTRCHGFVCPVERSVAGVVAVADYLDPRRFRKHELLRRDLIGLGMTPEQVDRLPQCAVPVFDGPEEVLGWSYVIERSTLGHNNLFRHLAMLMPGEVAFTSSYLKCYFGAAAEMWRAFGLAVDRFADSPERSERLLEAARTAFRTYRSWRHHRVDDVPSTPPPTDDEVQSA
jgi:heme oxygenase